MKLINSVAIAVSCLAASAQAQDAHVGAGLSVFGPIVEGSMKVHSNVEMRGFAIGGISATDKLTGDVQGSSYTIDGTASLGAFGVMADYYPTQLGWRVSAGLFASRNTIRAKFTGPETFDGRVAFDRDIAPMLTTGYRHSFGNGLTVSGELGAVFSGLTASSNSTRPQVQTEIAKINKELDQLNAVPYLSVTIGYKF